METIISRVRLFLGDSVFALKAFNELFNPLLAEIVARAENSSGAVEANRVMQVFNEFVTGMTKLRLFKLQDRLVTLFPLDQYYENMLSSPSMSNLTEPAAVFGILAGFAGAVESLLLRVFNLKNGKNLVTFHSMSSRLLKDAMRLSAELTSFKENRVTTLNVAAIMPKSQISAEEGVALRQALNDCSNLQFILGYLVEVLRLLSFVSFSLLQKLGMVVEPQPIWASSILPINTPFRTLVVRDLDGSEREINGLILNEKKFREEYLSSQPSP